MKQLFFAIAIFFCTAAQAQTVAPLPLENIFEPIQIGPGPGDTINAGALRKLLLWIEENDWQPGYKIINKAGSGALITKDTLDIMIGTDVKIIRCRKVKYKLVNGILKKQ